MNVRRGAMAFAALALVVLSAAPVRAERTSGARVATVLNNGARGDITVPYTTDGRSTFMNRRVEPRVYSSPTVEDRKNPAVRPVFNLPFYGSVLSFGDKSTGAVSKPGAIPLPNR